MPPAADFFTTLFQRLRSDPAVEYTHVRLEGPPPEGTAMQPGTQYLRVWLRSARITEVRRWTAKFHASVHAHFELQDPVQGRREVVCVVAPDKRFAEIDPRNLDRLIVVNQPLLGPVPWRGELACDIGLFSILATDLAKPYLNLLADLTATAGVTLLGKAMPLAEPIRRGAEMLFSENQRSELEIGLSRTDTRLSPGHWLVARVPKGRLPKNLRLDPDDYGLLDAQGRPVTGFPYMVIGVEALAQRDDYAAIPEVSVAWNAVRTAVTDIRPDAEVQQRFDQLRRVIGVSQELVPADKRRIVQAFAAEMRDAGYDVNAPAAAPASAPAMAPAAAAAAPRGPDARRGRAAPRRRALRQAKALLQPDKLAALAEDEEAAHGHDHCDAADPLDPPATAKAPPRARARAGAAGAMAPAAAAVRPWRLAASLQSLRDTVNALAPLRSKASDGSIGDAAHASRGSDHNPWVVVGGKGVVTAIDVTHDPATGCDAERLAESLRTGRDARIKYVIWNRRIFSATVQPWVWRPYTGSNPHNHHVHVSVGSEAAQFDDARPWAVDV